MKTPLWLTVAQMMQGISEIPGSQSNPVIMKWAHDIEVAYDNDDVAWCALFMNRLMLACQLPMAGSGYDLLRARTFASWGVESPRTPGAIMVFTRPEGAHVGLYLGERIDGYYVLGGNTSNSVSATWLDRHRLFAVRWPTGVPLRPEQLVIANSQGKLSTDEA